MTATGFVLIVLAVVIGLCDEYLFDLPEEVVVGAVLALMAGSILFGSGLTVWMWKVLP